MWRVPRLASGTEVEARRARDRYNRVVRRATIGDVARSCGLSKTTVSKVMNLPPEELDVPPVTRQRVVDAARALGYRPNWRARAFASRRTHTVGLIHRESVPLGGELLHEIIITLGHALHAAGYELQFVGASQEDQRWRELLLDERLDACIVVHELKPHVRDVLLEAALPAVLLNVVEDGPWPHVVADDVDGGMQVTRHLLSLGHRRIAFFDYNRPTRHMSARSRFTGMNRALAEAGLPPAAAPLVVDDPVAWAGQLVAQPRNERPTALVTYDVNVALPLLHGCWRHGLRVPADLSVATFNDVPATRISIPPLTAVAVPAREMAVEAVRLLMAQLAPSTDAAADAADADAAADESEAGTAVVPPHVVLPEHLTVRESTGAPPGV